MNKEVFTTFVAVNLRPDEMGKFISEFLKLECSRGTYLDIKDKPPGQRTLSIYVLKTEDDLLQVAFKHGVLHRTGWSKRFILKLEPTPGEILLIGQPIEVIPPEDTVHVELLEPSTHTDGTSPGDTAP